MATIGGSNIIRNGLVLDLDAASPRSYTSGSTIWNDVSGFGYTGSLVNGPTFSSANGGSIVFDGTNDYIGNSTYVPITIGAMTYEIVFRANTNPTNGPLGGSDIITTTPYFYLDYNGGSIKTYHYGSTPQYFTVQSLAVGSIYHFVCTRNGLTENNYVNGVPSLGRTLNNSTGNSNGFGNVGGLLSLSWYFNCNVYSIKAYNRALSPSEILQNYNAQKSRFGL